MKLIAPNLYTFENCLAGRVYMIEDPDGITIIDGSIAQSTGAILRQIESSGRKFTDIKRILLTHAHSDHVGALPELKAKSGGQIITSEVEKPIAEGAVPIPRPNGGNGGVVKGITVDRTVREGDVIEALGGLQVVAVPGHSPGHIAFWQPQRKILILGDTMMHVLGLRLPIAFATVDMDEAKRSIKKVAALNAEIACFGHGQPMTQDTAAQIKIFAAKQ